MNSSETITSLLTPAEMGRELATRVKNLRLLQGWKRDTLAERSGVSAASLKRFERTGQTSLENLLRLAHTFACLQEFDQLFRPPAAKSLTELEERSTHNTRKRGRL